MQTAMQDLRDDLLESIFKVNNRLDFLDNITDENVRNVCKVMVDTTLKGIVKRIDDELLEMEKKQIIDAYWEGGENIQQAEQYYNETYGSKGSDDHDPDVRKMVSSKTEISDEEIENRVREVGAMGEYYKMGYRDAIIWYREQLKQRQNG